MLELDAYIYDSQFQFLNKDDLLILEYRKSVLNSANCQFIPEINSFLRKEQWDSEKFSIDVARYLWMENKVNDEKYVTIFNSTIAHKCIYVRVNKEHTFCQFAYKNNLKLLTTKASQHLDLRNKEFDFDTSINYKLYSNESDEEHVLYQVLELSKDSFNHNRFKSDSKFTEIKISEIYRDWIVNEVKSNTSCLYYIIENKAVVAFFLYKPNISPLNKIKIGFVSLISSSPNYKEKKYASNLLNYVLSKMRLDTCFVIANTEIQNSSALSFFSKNNFLITTYLNEYHIWN